MRKPYALFAGLMILLVTLACGTDLTNLGPTPLSVVESPQATDFPGAISTSPPAEEPTLDIEPTADVEPLPDGEIAAVTWVTDGDTIEVDIDGARYDVRYIGVNTPERDEPCYEEATDANRALVEGQVVTLVKDVSDTDRYGRLLRYVYVGDEMVNELLVAGGWAEAVLYEPDSRYWTQFVMLEQAVEDQGIGCHSTGIFDDGSYER